MLTCGVHGFGLGRRSSLQQQLSSGEAAAAALQSSLSEARQTIASLQEEAAVLSKSRDTWKVRRGVATASLLSPPS